MAVLPFWLVVDFRALIDDLLLPERLSKVGRGEVRICVLHGLFENTFEHVPSPLQRVLDLIWKVLESAHWD